LDFSPPTAIRIGFELPSYTFIEPPIEEPVQIYLATENSRVSEQTFTILFELGAFNSSGIYHSAVLGEDYIAQRVTEIVLHPFTQRISYHFVLFPDDDTTPGETESFSVIISNSLGTRFPKFLHSEVLSPVAEVVIIEHDAESKYIRLVDQ
jgi:hypothetical protein